jgi:hypothetical protein
MQGTAGGIQLQYCKHDIFYYNDPFLFRFKHFGLALIKVLTNYTKYVEYLIIQ